MENIVQTILEPIHSFCKSVITFITFINNRLNYSWCGILYVQMFRVVCANVDQNLIVDQTI